MRQTAGQLPFLNPTHPTRLDPPSGTEMGPGQKD